MAQKKVRVKVRERWYDVEVGDTSISPVEVVVDGETFLVELDGAKPVAAVPVAPATLSAATPDQPTQPVQPPAASGDKVLRSPMPGRAIAICHK